MSRFSVVIIALITAVALLGAYCSAEDSSDHDKQMKQKLEYSKNILAGLVTEDFDAILKNAKRLNELGERRWLEKESTDYLAQNQVFWFNTNALILAAEKKNIDAATLSYTQMTVSCVNCHQLLRKQ